jgi:hypothetical protein
LDIWVVSNLIISRSCPKELAEMGLAAGGGLNIYAADHKSGAAVGNLDL